MVKQIKVLIYDLNGVLVDFNNIHYMAFNRALKNFFNIEITEKEFKKISNLSGKDKLKKIVEENNIVIPYNTFQFIGQKQLYMINLIKELISIDNTKLELHNDTLKYLIVVATNNNSTITKYILKQLGQLNFIDYIVTCNDVNKIKPDKEMFELILTKIDALPEECIVIEDNNDNIKTAKELGFNTIKVKNSSEVTSKFIIKKISEIENGK